MTPVARSLLYLLTTLLCCSFPALAQDAQPNARAPLTSGISETEIKDELRIQRNQSAAVQSNVPAELKSGTGLVDPNSFSNGFNLHADQSSLTAGTDFSGVPHTEFSVDLLTHYQIELFIDRSMSMRRRDCPGSLSRWEWCGLQTQNLAKSLAPYLPNGLPITQFASDSETKENASAQDIADIFARANLQFGTRLAEPLTARLNRFFINRGPVSKPLLIVVITDGAPYPPPEEDMVRGELISASRQMRSIGEVTIVFFQIGLGEFKGREFLTDVDRNLKAEGARFRYAHTIYFEDLIANGLVRTLVETIRSFEGSPR